MHLTVSPPLHMFQFTNPNHYLSFNDSAFLSPDFSYQDGIFAATFTYNSPIYNKPFSLEFTADQNVDVRFYATNNTEEGFNVMNDDPLLLAYYT